MPAPPRTEKSTSDKTLEFLQSETFENATLATSGTFAVATGAAVPFAVGLAAGAAGAAAGAYVGDKIGHAIAAGMGMSTVATEGENPAREGDAIAHQNKNAGLWGALGGHCGGGAGHRHRWGGAGCRGRCGRGWRFCGRGVCGYWRRHRPVWQQYGHHCCGVTGCVL
ncbi:hypothetical protein [Xenorhabdus bovienii]|uniref:hypothetical protein n=1 Tax=Xenorhabdus bovienii TaxID=40576 RepID=UPI00237CC47E|nr:hypothetical protein [Xenorhabdus bovienii]